MEDYITWIIMALIILVVFIYGKYESQRQLNSIKEKIKAQKGKLRNKEYRIERFNRMSGYLENHTEEEQIDAITWGDLDMDELFKKMDCTRSSTGEEYLYYLLHTPKSQEELEELEEKVKYYQEHDDVRIKHETRFFMMGNTGKFSIYDYLDYLDNIPSRKLMPEILKDLLIVPAIALLFINVSIGIVAIVAFMLWQMISYVGEKKIIEPYFVSLSYLSRLYRTSQEFINEKDTVFLKEYEILNEKTKNLSVSQIGSGFIFSQKGVVAGSNPLEMIGDYVKAIFHVDLILFYNMLGQIKSHLQDVDEVITVLGKLEAAMSLSLYRSYMEKEGHTYCLPVFKGENLILEGGVHPLLDQAVPNSIITEKGVLLTGSNASGKSTFLKMVALNAILAQTIHMVFAEKYEAPMYRVFSSMSLKDHIEAGESYFIVEIKAMKRIMDARKQDGKKVLCFVDEVLRGTNTVERIAAATQILKCLQQEGCTSFAATHDLELADLLVKEYDNYHFEEEIIDGDVRFSYLLKEGKATTRNAIRLLSVLNYDESLVGQAQEMADRFMKSGVWSM